MREIIERLEVLPGEIYEAERKYFAELSRLRELRNELANQESELFTTGKVKGASDKVRSLQLTQLTKEKNYEILRAGFATDCAMADWNLKKNEYETHKIILEYWKK